MVITKAVLTAYIKKSVEDIGGTFLKVNWKKGTVHYLMGRAKKTHPTPSGMKRGMVVNSNDK